MMRKLRSNGEFVSQQNSLLERGTLPITQEGHREEHYKILVPGFKRPQGRGGTAAKEKEQPF